MPTRPAALELLGALAAVLRSAGHRWYLFGAQAVVAYGRPRLTADVDVTVEVPPGRVPVLVEALERAGFRLRVARAEEFLRQTWVLPFRHEGSAMPLDLVLAGSGLEKRFLDRAAPVDVGGLTVPVISPEDLVIAKVLAGRPKDLEDVDGVLREQRGRLDLPYLRSTLAELERALEQTDLIPTFEGLLSVVDRR